MRRKNFTKIGISTKYTETDLITLMPMIYDMNSAMHFGEALEAMKLGFKVKRRPWSDDEYLILVEYGNQTKGDRKAGVVKIEDGEFRVVYSYIALVTADIFMPWTPTHLDILEEDWLML